MYLTTYMMSYAGSTAFLSPLRASMMSGIRSHEIEAPQRTCRVLRTSYWCNVDSLDSMSCIEFERPFYDLKSTTSDNGIYGPF